MTIEREELVALCDRGVVPVEKWSNRDSADAQIQLGQARALLAAGCDFKVLTSGQHCVSDDRTWWVEITWPGFASFDWGGQWETATFCVPTAARIDAAAGRDWY